MPRVNFFKLTLKLYKIYRPFLNPVLLPRLIRTQCINVSPVTPSLAQRKKLKGRKSLAFRIYLSSTIRFGERERGGGGEKERERTWGRSELVREYWPYVCTHFATFNPKFQKPISDMFTGWSSVLAEECVIRSGSWYHTEVLSQRSPREASRIMLCTLSIRI